MKLLTRQYQIIAVTCLLYTGLFNVPFITRFYAANLNNVAVTASGIIFLWAIHFLFFSVLAGKKTTKALLAAGFLIGSASSYFSSAYGVVVDTDMLQNAL